MKFLLHNHSSYPRIGDTPGQQRLRRAHADRARGAIDAAELLMAERTQMDEIVHEQEDAGIDIVTDGQVRWADPVSHVMGALDGVRLNGLLRYFDTNFYFRQPVITGTIRRRGSILRDDFLAASAAASARVKPVLPGPYTLARLSLIDSAAYRSVEKLAWALSPVVAAEVCDLAQAGAQIIQIEEPAILFHAADIRLLRRLLEPVWDARNRAELVLATYFGNAEPLYADLNSLPADVLALDCTYSPRLVELIDATGASKVLALGLIDGRNTRCEDPATVAARITTALRRYTLEAMHLIPSCGLEYLPRDAARNKLRLLTQTRLLLEPHA